MGSMETDPTTDRPLFPVTLTSISVIAPPFEDIIPRTTAEERKRLKEKQAEEQRMRELEEKKRNKGKK